MQRAINPKAGTGFRNVRTESGRVCRASKKAAYPISVLPSLSLLTMQGADGPVLLSGHSMVHAIQLSAEFAK
ncbi:unnamed protein product [Thelazia callipaeda]|uniref:Conserved domain protein n=1 Tax=Thelazia callipaeda TaxID=103827 RepID=A0A0N5CM39_THECL|nr:unnamed protein product [Thelazia callipaeda]